MNPVIFLMWVAVLEDGERVSEDNAIKLASSAKRSLNGHKERTPDREVLEKVHSSKCFQPEPPCLHSYLILI